MLSSKYRFHSRGGVKYTYKKGKTIRRPGLSLVFADNSRGHTRFAVVVSKKVLKSAIDRNRVRRRLYELIRLNLGNFKQPRDYIFVVFDRKIKDLSHKDLEKLVRSLAGESLLQ